jgi:hypothetical protein
VADSVQRPASADGLRLRAEQSGRGAVPRGVSATEGRWVVALAAAQAAMLAVTFQAASWPWGGLAQMAASVALLVVLVVVAAARGRRGSVHPRGYHRRVLLAGAWGVLVTGVGGLLGRSGLVTVPGPPLVTTLVAVAAVLPLGWVGYGLVRAAR